MRVKMNMRSVVTVILAGYFHVCAAVSTQMNGTDCADVRRTFVIKGIGQAQLVPQTWIKGDSLEICPSIQTCCSAGMEEEYRNEVKKDFQKLLQSACAYLKTFLSNSADRFRDTFLRIIQIAEKNSKALFADVYQSLEGQATELLDELFADFFAYIGGQNVDLEERVNFFFDSLFPFLFHHSANTDPKDFNTGFQNCLLEEQAEIQPYNDLPKKIAFRISKSFETTRIFLDALNLGIEVINTTEHTDFGLECKKAFVRLMYCPHCHGLIQAKPCAGMCLNVVRGCMASVSELDSHWSDYISALEKMTTGMVGIYNIEQVLSNINYKISETIMYVSENIVEITKRVKQKCGMPRRVTRTVFSPSNTTRLPRSVADYGYVYRLLKSFAVTFVQSKDFFSNLADRLCSDGNLVVKGDASCWNGVRLAEYTKTITGIGIYAQKFNPEMEPPNDKDEGMKTMTDKLQHMKKILKRQMASVPQSDTSILSEGSGSGASSFTDDEDYSDLSGSGDFPKDAIPQYENEKKVSTSTSGTSQNLQTGFIVSLLYIFIHCTNL